MTQHTISSVEDPWRYASEVLDVDDPETGEVIATVEAASAAQVDESIAAALGASQAPSAPRHRRSAVLAGAAGLLDDNGAKFVDTIVAEGVKTRREAEREVTRAISNLQSYASAATGPVGETLAKFDPDRRSEGYEAALDRVPSGVVAAITPFNDPLNLAVHKVGAAVAAGCPVIVKPHEATPLSAELLCELPCWDDLGAGAVQVLHGKGETVGAHLVSDPRIRIVSFTGGVSTGTKIAAVAGIKKLLLEMGGNCPTLIWSDASLETAVPLLVAGMTSAAGQNCLHVQRIYAHQSVYEELVARLVEALGEVRLGPKTSYDTDMGPLLTPEAAATALEHIECAPDEGGKVVAGGSRHGRSGLVPTLVTDLPQHHRLNTVEVFAPVTTITPVSSLDEALRWMNGTPTPLQAGVFTDSVEVAARCRNSLVFGAILINQTSDFRIDSMPFGGPSNCGIGREGGRWGIAELTEPRLSIWNRLLD